MVMVRTKTKEQCDIPLYLHYLQILLKAAFTQMIMSNNLQKYHPNMCIFHLYVFTTCGHWTLSSKPVVECPDAPSNDAFATKDSVCPRPRTHPFRTQLLSNLCHLCTTRRQQLMADLQTRTREVHFDEWKWRVAYRKPTAATDEYHRLSEQMHQGALRATEMERRMEALRTAKKKNAETRGDSSSGGQSGLRRRQVEVND